MTPGRKIVNASHCSYFPTEGASVRTRAPVEGADHDNFSAFEKRNYGLTFRCGRSRAGSARHCAAGMPDESRSLLHGVGVCSWLANQQQGGCGRRASSGEHLFPTVHHKIETPSLSPPARCGRARLQLNLHFAPTSPSAPQSSGYLVIVIRRSTRSWSCWTRYGRVSGPWVEGEPRECNGSAWDRLPPLVNAERRAA